MKIWLSLLSCLILLLAGCSHDSKNTSKSNTTPTESHSPSQSHPKMKEITWSDYIQQGHHVFYELESPIRGASAETLEGQGSIKKGFSIQNDHDQDLFKQLELKHMIGTQKGQTRQFNIKLNEDQSYTFDNFSKYSESDVLKKTAHIEQNLLDDLDTEKPSTYVDPIQILMTKDGQNKGISTQFNDQFTLSKLKSDLKSAPFNYAIDYNTSIKPFKYHGKYFAGLAKITDEDLSGGYVMHRLLITEVKNDHTLIKLDAAHSFDQAHTMHYESTHQGQDDQKEDAKKLDNL